MDTLGVLLVSPLDTTRRLKRIFIAYLKWEEAGSITGDQWVNVSSDSSVSMSCFTIFKEVGMLLFSPLLRQTTCQEPFLMTWFLLQENLTDRHVIRDTHRF
jgi:hypothetical protein